MLETHEDRIFLTDRTKSGMAFFSLVSLLFLSILLSGNASFGQDTLSTKKIRIKEHSIRRAALYSAAVPGLGQIYNRRAWKVPIIYAGFGVLGYFVYTNNDEFRTYKEAYIYVANKETYPIDNPYVDKYNEQQLQTAMDYYRRNRDLSIIITSLWYVLNVLEAYVDAHFFDYDISEDLSMRISPSATPTALSHNDLAPGFKITLKF